MSAAWATGDHYLWQQLRSWLDSLGSSTAWNVDLFINDYTPVAGDTFSNYETPNWGQWPSYFAIRMLASAWGPVQVVSNVAQSVNSTPLVWYRPPGVSPITVYGYVVSASASFVYAERWETPLIVPPNYTVQIVAQYNLANFPAPFLLNKKRGRKLLAPKPQELLDDDDDEQE